MVTQLKDQAEDNIIERQFKYDPSTTSGLTFGITGGYYVNGNNINEIESAALSLTDDDINYVYLDKTGPSITVSTSQPVASAVPLYAVTTVSGSITDIESWRAPIVPGFES